MTMYPYPENVTDLTSMAIYTNSVTDGLFWFFALAGFAITILLYTIINGTSPKKAFLGTTFLMTILAIITRVLTLINDKMLAGFIVAFIASLIWNYVDED